MLNILRKLGILILLLPLAVKAELRIMGFDASGTLAWTNDTPIATYRIEECPALGGAWTTNQVVTNVLSANVDMLLHPQRFFRVIWTDPPSTIIHTNITGIVGMGTLTEIDLDGDGVADLSLVENVTATGDGSEVTDDIHVRGKRVVLSPFGFGMTIGQDLPESHEWRDAKLPLMLASRRDVHGPWTHGPWAGVTTAFLPVEFTIGENVHYGWVSLTAETEQAWRINDAAYQTIPSAPITAGQTE